MNENVIQLLSNSSINLNCKNDFNSYKQILDETNFALTAKKHTGKLKMNLNR